MLSLQPQPARIVKWIDAPVILKPATSRLMMCAQEYVGSRTSILMTMRRSCS